MRRSCLLLSLGVLLWATAASAGRKPEDLFGGRILVSDKPFPQSANSAEAYIDAIKKNTRDRIVEDKESKEWRVFFAAFFKQPPNDLEIAVKVFDVTNGGKRLVDNFSQFLGNGQLRAYVSNLHLKRGDGTGGYDPNTKVLMVMEVQGHVIAEATFYLVGEVKKGNTDVDFSKPDN
jgi:hypothetical protein